MEILENCEITSLKRGPAGWIAGTSRGNFEAKLVLNAAGAWSEGVSALAGDRLKHTIRTSMMVVTERTAARIKPVIGSQGRKLSLKQTTEGTLLIGGGAQGNLAPDRQSASIDIGKLSSSIQAAIRLFPALEGVRIVRTWAGMEAETPDHTPVIGFSERVEGLIHAFGFSGHGFQLVPSVGRVLADLVCDGNTRHDLAAFSAARSVLEREPA